MPRKRPAQATRACAKKKTLVQPSQAQEQAQHQATATKTTNAVSQKQSQELTQSLLLASVSSILHLRDLIHPACFRLTQFDVESAEPWSYKRWKAGKMKTEHNDHTQSMHLLQREGSAKTRAFMDYIEHGAFDAISRGFLRAFQLKIFVDPDHQENVLETHTLHFTYHRPAGNAENVVSGIEMTGPEGKRISLVNLKIGLAEFIRGLSVYVDSLPELPEKRYFKPKLFYTDDCPDEYQAPGFIAPKTSIIGFPRNEELVRKTHRLNGYNGGYHSVNMSIAHVQWLHTNDGAIPAGSGLVYLEPASAPSAAPSPNLKLRTPPQPRRARHRGSSAATSEGSAKDAGQKEPVKVDEARAQPGTLQDEGANTSLTPSGAQTQILGVHTPAPETSLKGVGVGESEQDPGGNSDLRKRNDLDLHTGLPKTIRGKAVPEKLPMQGTPSTVCDTESQVLNNSLEKPSQNPEATQEGSRNANAARESRTIRRYTTRSGLTSQDRREKNILRSLRQQSESQTHDTQPLGKSGAIAEAASTMTQDCSRLELTSTKIEELNERKQMRDLFGVASAKNKTATADEISCQCGWNQEEEDNMIYCKWCRTWQHCSCYGFRGASDPRIPHEHACYSCLESVVEAGEARRKLKELKSFALLRRAIRVIEEYGFSDETSFAKALGGCDLQTASDVLARLVSEKAVTISNTGKSSFDKTKGRYHAIRIASEHSEIMDKFFDPLHNIGDCYISETRSPASERPKARSSTRNISRDSRALSVGNPQTSHKGQIDAPSTVRAEHSPLPGKIWRRLRPHSETQGSLDNEASRKGTLKRNARAEDRVSSPRPIKRINHGSPMAFTRGMSADSWSIGEQSEID